MHAAGIELDSLPDADRSGAEDDDFATVGRLRFVFTLVCRIEIRRHGLELGRARVDAFVNRTYAELMTLLPDVRFGPVREPGDLTVGEALALPAAHAVARR